MTPGIGAWGGVGDPQEIEKASQLRRGSIKVDHFGATH